jgi:hypothetical protein
LREPLYASVVLSLATMPGLRSNHLAAPFSCRLLKLGQRYLRPPLPVGHRRLMRLVLLSQAEDWIVFYTFLISRESVGAAIRETLGTNESKPS